MRYCPGCGEPLAPAGNVMGADPARAAYSPPGGAYPPYADDASWPSPDPYGTARSADPYASPPATNPYGVPQLPGSYGAPQATAPYGGAPAPPPYGMPTAPMPYDAARPGYYGQAPYGPAPANPPYGIVPAYGPPRFIESVYRPDQLATASPGRRLGAYALDVVLLCVTLLIGWLIWFCFTATRGQTPGMQLLNMYVLRRDGTRAGGWYMWLREFIIKDLLFTIVNLMTGGIGWLIAAAFCLWDRDRQCLWDKIGSTYVAYSPHRYVPATARELREAAQQPPQSYLP
jgi:uncharacterized RDD family membrane protein YckC